MTCAGRVGSPSIDDIGRLRKELETRPRFFVTMCRVASQQSRGLDGRDVQEPSMTNRSSTAPAPAAARPPTRPGDRAAAGLRIAIAAAAILWGAGITGCVATAPPTVPEPAPGAVAPVDGAAEVPIPGGAEPALRDAATDTGDAEADPVAATRPRIPPWVGDPAPQLGDTVTWFRGEPVTRGEPHILFFWGTWCQPCKEALPTLFERADALGIPIVAISRDLPERLEAFLATWPARFPHRIAIEANPYPVHTRYDAFTVPRFVVVDEDGRISRFLRGPRSVHEL